MQPGQRPSLLDRVAGELGLALALTPALRARVGHEQLRLVLTHTRLGTVAATIFAALMAWHYRGVVPAAQVDVWITAKLLVALGRIVLAQAYQRHSERHGDELDGAHAIAHWQRWTLALMALDGLVLGIGAQRMMGEPMVTTAVVVGVVDAMSCIATFGLQVHVAYTAAYVTPMLLATAVGLVQRQEEVAGITALGQLILLALLLSTARATSGRLTAGMLLRLQAQALVADKDAALQLAQQQIALRVQFLAKVSHELRTPLHGILGLSRLLHLESRDAAVTRRVELIEFSGTHLLGLINDLLDVSRTEAGRFTLHDERFELVAQVEQVAEVFALRAADRGLSFHWHCSVAKPHWVRGDAVRLRQVLHNLLGNAIKFTPQGEVRLWLAADGPRIELQVQDTGPGIGEAERSRIFQAFHQAERAGEGPTDGVGLGLTIAREIAQAMRGDIQVFSQPGQGATFVFTAQLPLESAPAPGLNGTTVAVGTLPGRVLVAEDDDVNALIVCGYLDKLGVAHERVADGKQAVSRALRETQRPQLVLMDCRMPVLDGLAATREIRAQERTLALPRVPVIALTAATAAADQAECLEAGMDAVVAKPFTLEQLALALRQGH
ncbi:ATP-binding protein [Aquabacterium sp.]|uniref:ATP-binding protein n=1 Tax=Aquabacterium sp. TaxID=1872578 RepID=UPI0037832EF9